MSTNKEMDIQSMFFLVEKEEKSSECFTQMEIASLMWNLMFVVHHLKFPHLKRNLQMQTGLFYKQIKKYNVTEMELEVNCKIDI